MEIKVQCGCGTRFAFDVEPVNGRMPVRVNCPGCGADGTDLARGGWSALAAFRSPAVRLSRSGTYVVRICLDGDGTGVGSLAVTAG